MGLGTDFFGHAFPDKLAAKDELMGLIDFRPEHRVSLLDRTEGLQMSLNGKEDSFGKRINEGINA